MAISPPNTIQNVTSNIACALLVIIVQYYFIHLKNIFKFTFIFFLSVDLPNKKKNVSTTRI